MSKANATPRLSREAAGLMLAQLVEPLVTQRLGEDYDHALLVPAWNQVGSQRPSAMTRRMAQWLKGKRCVVCGGKKRVQAHHMLPFHLWPQLAMEERLWLPVCRGNPQLDCHCAIGHAGILEGINIFVLEFAGMFAKVRAMNSELVRLLREIK